MPHPGITAPGLRVRRAQLGVGEAGGTGGETVEEEGEQDPHPAGDAGGDAGESEDAGTDHGADADHDDVEQTEIAAQGDLEAFRCWCCVAHATSWAGASLRRAVGAVAETWRSVRESAEGHVTGY